MAARRPAAPSNSPKFFSASDGSQEGEDVEEVARGVTEDGEDRLVPKDRVLDAADLVEQLVERLITPLSARHEVVEHLLSAEADAVHALDHRVALFGDAAAEFAESIGGHVGVPGAGIGGLLD
ncbi:hypothetical protein F8M49_20965 [Rhodococcus zopfii]|uniref:Uncharacterized protein n=1 Tax=Rhodococcus zopfii TaxID=43772 RepID=A0ABU3WT76_9NOCA|nr:hypothetical protein [Rhodococcus zopfii]